MNCNMNMSVRVFILVLLALQAPAAWSIPDQVAPDTRFPEYDPTLGRKLNGTIGTAVSDSADRLMAAWAEYFKRHHPDLKFDIDRRADADAAAAFVAGQVDLLLTVGPMSDSRIGAFREKSGYAPTAMRVARAPRPAGQDRAVSPPRHDDDAPRVSPTHTCYLYVNRNPQLWPAG